VLVDKRLSVGGSFGLHDLWMPALRKVVRWCATNRGYEVASPRERVLTSRERAKSAVAALLRRIPWAGAIWSQELLWPWHELEPSGRQIVFLRSTGEDDRDWRDYAPF
jgi:hypothetical protein